MTNTRQSLVLPVAISFAYAAGRICCFLSNDIIKIMTVCAHVKPPERTMERSMTETVPEIVL